MDSACKKPEKRWVSKFHNPIEFLCIVVNYCLIRLLKKEIGIFVPCIMVTKMKRVAWPYEEYTTWWVYRYYSWRYWCFSTIPADYCAAATVLSLSYCYYCSCTIYNFVAIAISKWSWYTFISRIIHPRKQIMWIVNN